jgi:hypothetical protein
MSIPVFLWPFGINILQPFGMLHGSLVYFMAIWSFLVPFGKFFGMLYQEKSGTTVMNRGQTMCRYAFFQRVFFKVKNGSF